MSDFAIYCWGVAVSLVLWYGAAAGIDTQVPIPLGVTMIGAFLVTPAVGVWATGRGL